MMIFQNSTLSATVIAYLAMKQAVELPER